MRLAIALISACLCSGCGILFQSIGGWTEVTHDRAQETHRLEIGSTPPGALIARTNNRGEQHELGLAPLIDEVPYQVDIATESPRVWPLVVGGVLADVVGGLLLVGVIGSTLPPTGEADPSVWQTLGALWGFGAVFVAAPIDLLTALIYGVTIEPKRTRTIEGDGTSYAYSARLSGHRERRVTVRVLEEDRLQLVLDPEPEEPEEPDDPTMPGGPR